MSSGVDSMSWGEAQERLEEFADDISKEFLGAPVIIVVGGSERSGINTTVWGCANVGRESGRSGGERLERYGRMRDRLGILEAAMQVDAIGHFGSQIFERKKLVERGTDS